jgi:hypothetical protein
MTTNDTHDISNLIRTKYAKSLTKLFVTRDILLLCKSLTN